MNKKLLFIISLLTYSFALQAQFTPDESVIISDSISSAEYTMPQISAADSGYYVTWYDEDSNFKMYLQYINPKGYKKWDTALVVTDHPQDSWVGSYSLITDGTNAYIFFSDTRNGSTDKDIFGYKINPQGEFLWGEDGIELVQASSYDAELAPEAAVLENGNVLAAWDKMDANGETIVMQQLTAQGDTLWPGGIGIGDGSADLSGPQVIPAGDSTAYVIYDAQTGGMNGPRQIKVKHINSNGENVWDSTLVITENSGIGMGRSFQAAKIQNNQLCISWYGDPDGNMQQDVFAQVVTLQGTCRYADGGLNLSPNTSVNQTSIQFAGEDENNNTVFVWQENNTIKLQKVDTAGQLLHSAGGLTVISQNVETLKESEYVLGKTYMHFKETNSNKANTGIYHHDDDSLQIKSIDSYSDIMSDFKNGQFVFASSYETNTYSHIHLQNCYRNGKKGVSPIIKDCELYSLAGIKGFRPDSVFYYQNADTPLNWQSFYQPVNIYQQVNVLDSPAHEAGNYRLQVTAEDSSEKYYQFSYVNEPETSVDTCFTSDNLIAIYVNAEQSITLMHYIVKTFDFHLEIKLSPGARLFINNNWDAAYQTINDTINHILNTQNFETQDTVLVNFQIVDYLGNIANWHFIFMDGGGAISSTNFQGKIYPNPANEKLFIESVNKMEELAVFTIDGKQLKTIELNQSQMILPVSDLKAGIYILRIRQHNGVSFKRFIKN